MLQPSSLDSGIPPALRMHTCSTRSPDIRTLPQRVPRVPRVPRFAQCALGARPCAAATRGAQIHASEPENLFYSRPMHEPSHVKVLDDEADTVDSQDALQMRQRVIAYRTEGFKEKGDLVRSSEIDGRPC